jgi:hypothetical protein
MWSAVMLAVLGAQQVLQEHLEAVGQRGAAVDRVEPIDRVGSVTDLQLILGSEAVHRCVDAGHVGSFLKIS